MDELYDQASFISAIPRVFVEKVYTLQNPTIASRVRNLVIWPSAIRDAINGQEHEPVPEPRIASPAPGHRRTHSNLIDRGRSYMDRLLDKKPSPSAQPTREPLISSEERATLFSQVIRQITRLDELQIVWYLDKDREHAWKFPYFSVIWRAVGHNIRRLSMDVQLHVLADVTSTCGTLQQLEWLELTLRKDKTVNITGDENAIPYFVNKIAPTLQFLSIKTIGHQSLSFFDLFESFPRLTSLALVMPLDSYHLPDPSGLHQFLRDHDQIRTLSIRYSQCCRDRREDGFTLPGDGHRIFSKLSLRSLQSLELGLYLPPGRLQATKAIPHPSVDTAAPWLASIARIGSSLSSLTLVDRCMTLDEVRLVLKAFPTISGLKKLSLYVKRLSPQLIDLIAVTCTALSSLTLDVETVVRRDAGLTAEAVSQQQQEEERESDVDGFVMALYDFAIEDDEYRYSRWTLTDIAILTWEFKVGKRLNWTCMRAVAGVVPTVRRFAGKEDAESTASVKIQVEDLSTESRRPSVDSQRSRHRQAAIYGRPSLDNSSTPSVAVRHELAPLRRRVDVASLPSRLDI